MPGQIKSVAVEPGQEVIENQELLVIEAMKMQNILRSARAGIVQNVHVKPNDTVAVDATLIEFV